MSRKINLDGLWYPSVVLGFKGDSAIIGIEGVPDDPRGHYISYKDVTWAHKDTNDGSAPIKAKRAQDLLSIGDVIYVRALLDENDDFKRWTLRQISEVQGAFMAMDVNTGRVLAMQGGFDYDHSVFNRATQADRQPGSSFKPFVYASALDSKYTPATVVIDAPIEFNTPEGLWRPKNASSKFYGPTPLRTGIEKSRNLMTIRVAQDVGMKTIADYAERFGVYMNMRPYLANSLGAEETTLYKMVAAYAMFANGGERVEPTLVDRIQDRFGKTVYRHDPRTCDDCMKDILPPSLGPEITSDRERVMDAVTAYQLTSMMEGVVTRGTASRTVKLPVPTAGKTGTTNEAKDAWFVGFTSNIVAGCYIGFDIPSPLGRGTGGGSTCGPVFNEFMLSAIKKYGGGDFKVPKGGKFINLHRLTGDRLDEKAEGDFVVAEYFRDGEEPTFGDAVNGGFAMGSNIELFSEEDEQVIHTTSSSGEIVTFGGTASLGTLTSGGLY
jgi:penicillin-binding protein 1A